jgi:hypothetical protein
MEAGSVPASACSEEYFPQDGLPDDYDPATVNDFSYEDALLDSRVRLFMHEEYGTAEPPQGMFQRVIKLLNPQQATENARPVAALFAGMYRTIGGQTLSRIVPSGIAVAVLVVVGLSSSVTSLSHSMPFSAGVQGTPVSELADGTIYMSGPAEEQASLVQALGLSTLDATGGEEAYIVLRGSISVNLPLDVKVDKEPDNPKYNRLRLDPF